MNDQEIRARAIEIVIAWLTANNRTQPWDDITRMADRTAAYIKGEAK